MATEYHSKIIEMRDNESGMNLNDLEKALLNYGDNFQVSLLIDFLEKSSSLINADRLQYLTWYYEAKRVSPFPIEFLNFLFFGI